MHVNRQAALAHLWSERRHNFRRQEAKNDGR